MSKALKYTDLSVKVDRSSTTLAANRRDSRERREKNGKGRVSRDDVIERKEVSVFSNIRAYFRSTRSKDQSVGCQVGIESDRVAMVRPPRPSVPCPITLE